jgi:hypothetical protein
MPARRRKVVFILAGGIVLGIAAGIGWIFTPTTIHPPADAPSPVTVLLLDHGRHTSIVLPGEEGAVRFAYGEMNYYARDQRGFFATIRAGFWPTPGALGRRAFPFGPEDPRLPDAVGVHLDHVMAIQVPGERAHRLRRRLDRFHAERVDQAVVNPYENFVFVPHPGNYHLLYSSNQVAAGWLEELGCTVRGPATHAIWRIGDPR